MVIDNLWRYFDGDDFKKIGIKSGWGIIRHPDESQDCCFGSKKDPESSLG